jgi:hypothetical protein
VKLIAMNEAASRTSIRSLLGMASETVEAPPDAPAAEPAQEEKKSALEEAFDQAEPKDENGGVKPPQEGPCRECRRLRRLNRLRLCYPCFVVLNIADVEKKAGREWTPDMPHPSWCYCEGLGEHRKPDGSDRGAN